MGKGWMDGWMGSSKENPPKIKRKKEKEKKNKGEIKERTSKAALKSHHPIGL
jgi:hypothetical protein